MSLVLKKRLKTPRKIPVIRLNQIWQMLSEVPNEKGIEINQLANFLLAEYSFLTKEEWIFQLCNAYNDGLLTYWKGNDSATIFGLPRSNVHDHNFGDRDWYCFICHKEGDVVRCPKCTKSFHRKCLLISLSAATFDLMDKPCLDCSMIKRKESMDNIPNVEKLNEIVSLLVKEILDWKMEILNNVNLWPRILFGDYRTTWRSDYLLYSPIDLVVIYNKALQKRYLCLEEFRKDCKTLVHNLGVFFGTLIIEKPSIGEKLWTKVELDLGQISTCHDCFLHSKKKEQDEWWFSKPCSIQHQVVWADAPGYRLPVKWPAKVLKRLNGAYLLAFFGSSNFQKVLAESKVHPIDTVVNADGMTREWKRAVAELEMFKTLNVSVAPTSGG